MRSASSPRADASPVPLIWARVCQGRSSDRGPGAARALVCWSGSGRGWRPKREGTSGWYARAGYLRTSCATCRGRGL